MMNPPDLVKEAIATRRDEVRLPRPKPWPWAILADDEELVRELEHPRTGFWLVRVPGGSFRLVAEEDDPRRWWACDLPGAVSESEARSIAEGVILACDLARRAAGGAGEEGRGPDDDPQAMRRLDGGLDAVAGCRWPRDLPGGRSAMRIPAIGLVVGPAPPSDYPRYRQLLGTMQMERCGRCDRRAERIWFSGVLPAVPTCEGCHTDGGNADHGDAACGTLARIDETGTWRATGQGGDIRPQPYDFDW